MVERSIMIVPPEVFIMMVLLVSALILPLITTPSFNLISSADTRSIDREKVGNVKRILVNFLYDDTGTFY